MRLVRKKLSLRQLVAGERIAPGSGCKRVFALHALCRALSGSCHQFYECPETGRLYPINY